MSKETMVKSNLNTRSSLRRLLGAAFCTTLLACLLSSPALAAAPKLAVEARHVPSVVPSGGSTQFRVKVTNRGDAPTSGPITVAMQLPFGISAESVTDQIEQGPFETRIWTGANPTQPCDISEAGHTVTCHGPDPSFLGGILSSIPPGKAACDPITCRILISASADPGVPVGKENTITTACGGGALACATDVDPTEFGTPHFGLQDWDGDWVTDDKGAAFTQAAGHPYAVHNTFDFNLHPVENDPEGTMVPDGGVRNITAALPPGFVGAPNATPQCESSNNLSVYPEASPDCPINSVVGAITVRFAQSGPEADEAVAPIFNMKPAPGVPAQFGFNILGVPQIITASLRSDGDYGISINGRSISQAVPVSGATTIFWGTPADPSHDFQRCLKFGDGATNLGTDHCTGEPGTRFGPNPASVGTPKPFLTNSSSCTPEGVGKHIDLHVESYQRPSQSDDASFNQHVPGDRFTQVATTGCDIVPFDPDITVQPTARQADTPSGLEVNLRVPSEGLNNPTGIAQSNLKKAVVALPKGMTVNPSFADGVAVCTPQQIGLVSSKPPRFDLNEPTCPEASKIGSIHIETALLNEPVNGELILAQSNNNAQAGPENPFDSLVALYIVARGPGLLIKLAGQVSLDPDTGQLITSFDENPPVPFSLFTLSFKGGPRAPLVTPSSCGTYTSEAKLSPYARPDQAVTDSDAFQITQGPGGSPCRSARPFNPLLKAGTLSNNAGSYSPFTLRMSREDGEQEISSFSSVLPPGLSAKLAGVSKCSDRALALAAQKSGIAEKQSPSCPAQSKVGSALTGSGSGQILTYVPGSVYLAGPYNGAPLSVATIVPAQVGPFDVGTIIVRAALRIDTDDAQVHVDPVPIPYIRDGIALHVRDIRVNLDRNRFALNPTNCNPSAVTARMLGTGANFANPADDVAANLSDPFQVANCQALGFKPKLTFKLKGGTHRGDFPAFEANLTARPGDANIAASTVILPRSEFIEQNHIVTVCTRVQFAKDQCPAGSIYGYAKATTPLLDKPVEGPVYLRSNGGERVLPDLVASLNGDIDVALVGFIDSVKGRVRNVFNVIPDAPVTKFTLKMRGGKKGLLVNHLNLCEVTSRAAVKLVGQNAKVSETEPKMGTSCKGRGKSKKRG